MPQKPLTDNFNVKHWEGDLAGGGTMTETQAGNFNLDLGDFTLNFPPKVPSPPGTPGGDPELPPDPDPATTPAGSVRYSFTNKLFYVWTGTAWVEKESFEAAYFDPTTGMISYFDGNTRTDVLLTTAMLRFNAGTVLQQLNWTVPDWEDVTFPTSDPGGGAIWLSDT